jgi:glycosyltransferase involved in cell wall biosynthesis
MRILMLSHVLPHPANNGAKLRILNLARQLAGHELALLCPAPAPALDDLRRELGGTAVAAAPWPEARGWRAWRGYLARAPREIYPAHPGTAARHVVDAWVRDWRPDLLIATDPILGEYVRAYPQCRRMVDIAAEYTLYIQRTMRLASPAARPMWTLRLLKWAAYTRSLADHVDLWAVPSPVDRQALVAHLAPGARVVVVPNGVDLEQNPFAPDPTPPPRLAYCGALSYAPNRDAVLYFSHRIWPRVRERVLEAQFMVTGDAAGAPASLRRVAGLTLTGHLPEVRSLLVGCRAAVVPLRLGVGTRLKIMEAMAVGTPVVSTSVGAEGLEVTDGENILIADDAARFADKVVQLLLSPTLRAHISRGGRALVEERYAWEVIGRTLRAAVAELAAGPAAAADGGRPLTPTPITTGAAAPHEEGHHHGLQQPNRPDRQAADGSRPLS